MNVKLQQAISAVQNGLNPEAAAAKYGVKLEDLSEALNPNGGGAPVDGLERKPVHEFTLKSGRRVEVYQDASGKNTFKYFSADGTQLQEAYFLKQEGMTGSHFAVNEDGKLVSVKDETENEEKAEEQGFFAKAWNKIKNDFAGYGQNFAKAWNNSDGFLETTGALIGATTRTATDMIADSAENVEKGVTEITGSETAGKVAKYATVGIAADAVKAVDQVGDWGADKIRAAAANYTGSERALLEGFADFVDDMNAADIALMFVGGIGAAKYAKELPKIMNLLKISPAAAKATGTAAAVAGAATLTSCTDDDEPVLPENINNENNATVNVTIPPQDQSALINAFKEGIDALLKKIEELQGKLNEMGLTLEEFKDQVIQLLVNNNTYLKTISEQLKQSNFKQDEIIEILTNINSTVQTIEALAAATNENITVNGESIKAQLTEILNEIKNGNINSTQQLEAYMEKLTAMLQTIIEQQGENIEINQDSNLTLDAILAKLDEIEAYAPEDKLEAILELLKSIESIGKDISGKLDVILGKFDEAFPDNDAIKEALARIEAYIKENNDKTDVTNKLLEQLLNQYNSGGISQEDLQKLLDAIAANGDKIDATNQLLAKIQNENAEFRKQVLELLSKVGPDYSEVLNKLLDAVSGNSEKLDAIAQLLAKMQDQDEKFQKNVLDAINKYGAEFAVQLNALMDAIKNISVGGGGISEADLEKLLNAIIANGDKIDATNELLAKIQNENAEFQKQVLELLSKVGPDYSEVLNKLLDAVSVNSEKLDAIAQLLAKMQDQDEKFQKKVLDAINKYGAEFAVQLNALMDAIKNISVSCGGISEEDMQKLLDAIIANGDKIDATNELLAKIQNENAEFQKKVLEAIGKYGAEFAEKLNAIMDAIKNISVGGGGLSEADLEKLLNAIVANGDKIDAVAQLLAKMQDQDEKFQQNVLKAISELGINIAEKLDKIMTAIKNVSVSGGDTSNLEALLEKVLAKMDENTAAIIDAMSNIKPGEGGTVDLSSIEKMLSELLQLTSKNNSLLESIDGKMDVIKLTIEAAKDEIIAHLGNGGSNVDVDAILNKLDEFMSLSNANSEAILKKMDTIINLINNIKDSAYDDSALMAKLDDILAAIKDHNITVDITGKVECNCNCGGNHEGILGDLDDILG